MTFSYDASLGDDESLVRFHIGDTHEEGAYLADETVTALIASEGSVGGAVIAAIKYIITQLSSPDFKKDWLSVNHKDARDGYQKLLVDKAQEFGIKLSNVTAKSSISLPSRKDSYQTDNSFTSDTEDNYYSGVAA